MDGQLAGGPHAPSLPPRNVGVPDAVVGWADFLDFAVDECPLFGDMLDPQTLNAMSSHVADACPPPLPISDDTRKKLQEQDSDNSEAEEEAGKGKGGSKRARTGEGNVAAKNKASREKARREKINDR